MRPVPVAVIGLFLLLAAGCGGVENEPNLAKAVERTEATGSSRIVLRAPLVEEGRQLDFRCEGTADYERKRLRLGCNYGAFGEMVVIGDTQYFTGGAFGGRVDKRWVKAPVEDNDSLNYFSPVRLLGMLRTASLETVRIGEESVRQVQTVRYRLTVNCDEAQLSCLDTTAPVDVWIDDDGLVRMVELEFDESRGTIEFFDFGVEVDIEAPPADEVQEADEVFPPETCATGEARPISVSQAIETLRRHGFDMSTAQFGCSANVAAPLSNMPSDGQHWDETFDQQGFLSCFLLLRPAGQGPTVVVTQAVIPGGASERRPVERNLENLRCTLFTDGSNTSAIVERLDAAFADLKRAVQP